MVSHNEEQAQFKRSLDIERDRRGRCYIEMQRLRVQVRMLDGDYERELLTTENDLRRKEIGIEKTIAIRIAEANEQARKAERAVKQHQYFIKNRDERIKQLELTIKELRSRWG